MQKNLQIDLSIKNDKYMQILHPSQKSMSTYLCYVMADSLLKNGYKLPMEKFRYNGVQYKSPRVEVKSIMDGHKNILGDLGGTQQNYSVKTIIVLARPNMYVFSDEIKCRIQGLF